MPEEERALRVRESYRKAMEFFRENEQYLQRPAKVPDQARMARFRKLAVRLVDLAEKAGADILVEDDEQDCTGHVVLEGKKGLLLAVDDHASCKTLSDLLRIAGTAMVDASDGLCRLSVWVDLRKKL